MRLLVAALLVSPRIALACSMIVTPPNLGLPGASAGPDAVFTTASQALLLGPDDVEIDVTRVPYFVEGEEAEVLVPVAPLPPGDYRVDRCDFGAECEATIAEGGGDPGVPPAMPELSFEPIRIYTGRRADCGPTVPGTDVHAESDAVVVIFAAAPVETLADADLLGFARDDGEGDIRWMTEHRGEVFAAAVDAEGELSEWTGPHTLAPAGCSSTGGGTLGLVALLLAAGAIGRRTRR